MRSLCVIALAGATTLQCSANLFALQPTQTSANGQETSALKQNAKSGDAKAQVQLGLACATVDGVPKNEGEFVKCFRIAADQGDATSEYHLSEMYFTGQPHRPGYLDTLATTFSKPGSQAQRRSRASSTGTKTGRGFL